MAFRPPSRAQLLVLFLALAPAVWPFSLYATSYAGLNTELFRHGVISGLLILIVLWWFFGLLMPWAWFFTWIPTVLAALVCQRTLSFICARYAAQLRTRLVLVGICSVVCGITYAAVFAISTALIAHRQAIAQIGSLSQMALSVGVTGAVLGVIVGAWPRLTPSCTSWR